MIFLVSVKIYCKISRKTDFLQYYTSDALSGGLVVLLIKFLGQSSASQICVGDGWRMSSAVALVLHTEGQARHENFRWDVRLKCVFSGNTLGASMPLWCGFVDK